MHEMLKRLSFFLLLFSLYNFLFYFYYGKLGKMGNFAGWRNERGCTRYVQRLPDGTYQLLNKDARVKLYIHKAKPCILFCLAPCASVSFLDYGGLFGCLGCSCCSLVSFHFLQKVSGQQIFEKCLKIFFWKYFIILFFLICCSHPLFYFIYFSKKDIFRFFYQKVFISFYCGSPNLSLNKTRLKFAQTWRSILTKYSHRTLERWSRPPLHVVQFFLTCHLWHLRCQYI